MRIGPSSHLPVINRRPPHEEAARKKKQKRVTLSRTNSPSFNVRQTQQAEREDALRKLHIIVLIFGIAAKLAGIVLLFLTLIMFGKALIAGNHEPYLPDPDSEPTSVTQAIGLRPEASRHQIKARSTVQDRTS